MTQLLFLSIKVFSHLRHSPNTESMKFVTLFSLVLLLLLISGDIDIVLKSRRGKTILL